MEPVFKAKVRRIGTSLGILIPKELLQEKKISEGDEIELSILKKRKELIDRAFGIPKGIGPFTRAIEEKLTQLPVTRFRPVA